MQLGNSHSPIEDDDLIKFTKVPVVKDVGVVVTVLTVLTVGVVNVVGAVSYTHLTLPTILRV